MTENNETTSKQNTIQTLGYNSNGVMGSTTTNTDSPNPLSSNEKIEIPLNKVAIFSTRNVYADTYGNIKIGYNIVGNKHAEFWLQQSGIRLATPEELLEAFA